MTSQYHLLWTYGNRMRDGGDGGEGKNRDNGEIEEL